MIDYYDHETGKFFYDDGAEAGHVRRSTGYVVLNIGGVQYKAHRLAWYLMHGYWPDQVDHINGDRADNRIVNLRACNSAENHQNRKVKGYTLHKASGKYQAMITVKGKAKYLGLFDTPELALAAYCEAKRSLHKYNPEARL